MPKKKVWRRNECYIYMTYLFEMVNGQPYLSLGIEHAAQVAPSHCKVGLSLNSFQVTGLEWVHNEKPQERRRRGRVGEV